MTRRRALRRALTAGAALLVALPLVGLLAVATAPAVRAADAVQLGAPSASGTLGGSITFRQTIEATVAPQRVDLLLQEPGVYGDVAVQAVVSPVTGGYQAQVEDTGHVLPNTTIGYRFRVVTPNGAALGPAATFTLQDDRYTWQTLTGTHVRLHWYSGDHSFAQKALAVGDEAVTRVAALLGVQETQPIDFFVYASADGLDGALGPGTSEFVAGRAIPEIRTLFAEIDPDQIDSSWVTTVIPHELTHLVFDTATHNPFHQPPLWLNEGLAVYESIGFDTDDRGLVRDAAASGGLLPLTGLTGAFPSRQDLFYLSYAEAVSAVDFFVRSYGQAHLVQLIRSYAAGVTDDGAFQAAAGMDVAAFQAAWLADLRGTLPAAYGPRAPAAGPLPSGWGPVAGGAAGGSPLPTTAPHPAGPAAPGGGTGALSEALAQAAQPLVPIGLTAIAVLLLVTLIVGWRRRAVRRRGNGPPGPGTPVA